MITLSVIILTYNSEKHIIRCLESLLEVLGVQLDAGEIQVLVFDNKSTDNTPQVVKDFITHGKIKNVDIFKNDTNDGFAKGINTASKHAKGEYLLFLNPDTEVMNDKIFEMIGQFDKGQKVAVVGGKIRDFSNSDEKSAGKFYTLPNLFMMVLGLEEVCGIRYSPQKISDVDFVSGGFMMVKKTLFEKAGGFDEKLFMYVEDMEFCYRIKQMGFRILFVPNAIIKHLGQGSSSRQFAVISIYKGILYFAKKHRSPLEYQVARQLLITKAKIAILVGSILKNKDLVQTYSKAQHAI